VCGRYLRRHLLVDGADQASELVTGKHRTRVLTAILRFLRVNA
jgi:hypothetical protein